MAIGRCKARLRRLAKASVFVLFLASASPFIVIAWLEQHLARTEALFQLCAQLLAWLPGFLGHGFRGAFYVGALERCSWETRIGFGSLFTHRTAVIEPRVSMGAYCVVGHAHIGSDVRIGSRVSIPSGKRQHLDDAGRLASVERFERVSIGIGSWIGEGAIVLADVGRGCIVSAGAVVTQSMPDRSLVGGNPARIIRPVESAPSIEGS